MPGDFRCDRGDYARVLFYFAREAAGALDARHSLRPLIFSGQELLRKTRACAARSRTYVSRHCEERSDEAIHSFFAWRDALLLPTGRVRRTNWLMMQTTGSGLWNNRLRQSGRLAQLT